MKFPWKGLIVAPLVVPFLFSLACMISFGGKSPVFGFFFNLVLGSVCSYGATIFLFLPCLYLLSKLTR